jgi:uncharacterized protein HemX
VGEENTDIEASGEFDAAPESNEEVASDQSEVASDQSNEEVTNDRSNLYAILVFVGVVILAGVGYFFLQQLRSQQEGLGGELDKDSRQITQLNDQQATLLSQLSTLQMQMATVQTSVANRESKFERELAEFGEHHGNTLKEVKEDLTGSIDRIHDLLNRTRGDWMVADAEYMLNVANQRLNLVGDLKTALGALSAADDRLRDSGNPGVFKVREQIAREISALKGLKTVDIVGIFAKIKVLEKQVAEIQVFLPHSGKVSSNVDPKEAKPQAEDTDYGIGSIDNLLGSALADLKGMVTVRRTDREFDAILYPEQVQMIREKLKLKLEIVRLALVEHDSALYSQNLQAAKDWLKTHFLLEDSATKKFAAELDELAVVGLEIAYPDISGSLKLLQNVAALRVRVDRSSASRRANGKSRKGKQ